MLEYKDYQITYRAKPGEYCISPDFDFVHRDWDGIYDRRIGSCDTVKGCMQKIDLIENDCEQGNTASLIAMTVIAILLTTYILFWSY